MLLSSVRPSLYYKPADEVDAAIKSASLVWAKKEDLDDDETPGGDTPGGDTPVNPDPDNPGGGGDDGGGDAD